MSIDLKKTYGTMAMGPAGPSVFSYNMHEVNFQTELHLANQVRSLMLPLSYGDGSKATPAMIPFVPKSEGAQAAVSAGAVPQTTSEGTVFRDPKSGYLYHDQSGNVLIEKEDGTTRADESFGDHIKHGFEAVGTFLGNLFGF
jgi:hypothetical protein